jgi:molybdate transport system ATP-binding protein
MDNYILKLEEAVARNPLVRLKQPVSLTIAKGEQVVIVGENGAGKSLLVDMMTGKAPLLKGTPLYDFSPSKSNLAYENIKYITFRDSYGAADTGYYYQQRWHSQDIEDVPLAGEYLKPQCDDEYRDELYRTFGIEQLAAKKIVLLSSGELRKFQLVKNLLSKPRLLIVDNPYIGLDAPTRDVLTELFEKLTSKFNIQIILIMSRMDDIPPFATHVIPMSDMVCGEKVDRTTYFEHLDMHPEKGLLSDEKRDAILSLPLPDHVPASDEIIRLNKVSIVYGERTILKELDWSVRRGEHWALRGQNGCGKSTLLSLICADNPQSYACDIHLFGNKRGTGECIWDIKKHIGFVSPEMHRSYQKNVPVIDIVASGLHDTIGLYKQSTDEQKSQCRFWLKIFGIERYEQTPFLQLSSGEQRLALLARAFVKDPSLLILDEPLHGLDTYNRRLVKSIIETFCQRPDKTLLMVTHYAQELPRVIDHEITLKKN